MIDPNYKLIETLRNQFLEKIKKEWNTKWLHHGETFNYYQIKSQNAFLNDVIFDIEKELKSKVGLDETAKILISTDNLRRIFINTNQSNWQDRTKNTIALYLNYANWNDFVSKQTNTHLTHKKQSFFSKNQFYILSGFAVLFIALLWSGYNTFFLSEILFEEDFNNKKIYNIGDIDIKIKIPEFELNQYSIYIENEIFQYIKQPNIIKVKSSNYIQSLKFYTPGYKKITLRKNKKIEKQINFLVPTGKSWYACVRQKVADVPSAYENDTQKAWFGFKDKSGNTVDNFISTPDIWNGYLKSINGKMPNEEWHFPDELLNKKENYYSRVALYKAAKFNLDLDSMAISFRAKKDKKISEDCMSFMLEMFDNNFQKFEIYSSQNCTVISNYVYTKWVSSKKQKMNHYVKMNNNLNKILEDSDWHRFNIEIKGKKILIKVDNHLIVNDSFNSTFGKLREILFVFEHNGHVDDIILENSTTKKNIFHENFSHIGFLNF